VTGSAARDVAAVDERAARGVTSLAALVAATLCLALPATQFWNARARESARMGAEARIAAAAVSALANRNPEFWQFENHRIAGLIDGPRAERVRVILADGEAIAESEPPGFDRRLPLVVQAPVHDAGRIVGAVEVTWSMTPLVNETLKVAALALALGLLAFLLLRMVPMRLLRRAIARAAFLAQHDPLTALPNRALFHDRLRQALQRARREGHMVAVLCLDLDHFKAINDTLGHAAGDALLREVAARITPNLRGEDTLARLGGDEFAIVLTMGRQAGDAEALARRVIATLQRPFELEGHQAAIGVSVGIALRTGGEAGDAEALLQEAALGLLRAKSQGRGTWCFFEAEMNLRLRERRALEADLQKALLLGELHLAFQPQVDLSGRRLVGAEALIRWTHPRRGPVTPDLFIPLAEETGLIIPIGRWVLGEACREAARWPGHARIAVNVSPVQFRASDFISMVDAALATSGLLPARLELEVTEGVLLNETEETLRTLEQLRALGVSIAMDDFGTGYSSLGYLRKFQFDKIKIDRSFVGGLGRTEDAMAIIRAVIGMSRALGIRCNAEGVETEEQARMLREEQCDEVQGFLFGRPMSASEWRAVLRAEPRLGRAA
jgi:diguanylate cyclase (GGDEF)-like protein